MQIEETKEWSQNIAQCRGSLSTTFFEPNLKKKMVEARPSWGRRRPVVHKVRIWVWNFGNCKYFNLKLILKKVYNRYILYDRKICILILLWFGWLWSWSIGGIGSLLFGFFPLFLLSTVHQSAKFPIIELT